MKHVVLVLSLICVVCCGSSCGLDTAVLPHTGFDGMYSLTPVGGPRLRFRISQGTVVSFEEASPVIERMLRTERVTQIRAKHLEALRAQTEIEVL